MLFSSYSFLFCFLPLLVVLYFIIPERFRNYLLLAASLGFYAWGGPKYLLIMLLSILINYCGGLAVARFMEKTEDAKSGEVVATSSKESVGNSRMLTLITAVVVLLNLGLLGYYKYTDFFLNNINSLCGLDIPLKGIVMPIGISFYTFQGMSYVFDVKRKRGAVLTNPLDLALYISFFPQLIAGPIVRYETIATQIHNRVYVPEKINYGIFRFVIGLSKKVLLANTIGELADYCFNLRLGELNIISAWAGIIAYTLQIYFDFSGYSDMAIGLGKVFGFDFTENFNYPYIAASITDYWKRWHISMTKWFTDYVYIPLGGNRKGEARQYLNMLIVWALSGLWHGANWNFVIWGLYYAVILIVERFIGRRLAARGKESGLAGQVVENRIKGKAELAGKDNEEKMKGTDGVGNCIGCNVFKHIITLVLIMIGWVIFNSPDMTFALSYICTMFGGGTAVGSASTELSFFAHEYGVVVVLGIVAATPLARNVARKVCAKIECVGTDGAVCVDADGVECVSTDCVDCEDADGVECVSTDCVDCEDMDGVKCAEDISSRRGLALQGIIMVALLLLCTMRLVVSSYNPFIYFRF